MKSYKMLSFFIILLCFVLSTGCALLKYKEKIKNTVIEDVDFTKIQDGDYTGEYDVFLVNAKVNVKVEGGRIVDIKLIEHKHGKGYSGEAILSKVIEKQTLKVDTISGATGSSKTILKSIEKALKREK